MYKKIFFCLSSLLISLLLIPIISQAEPVLDLESSKSVSLEIDNINGGGSDSESVSFLIYNRGNITLNVYSISPSSLPEGISISFSRKPSVISPGSYDTAELVVYANSNVEEGSQKVVVEVETDGGIDTITINLDVNVLTPAKLGTIGDKSITVEFNKPKGTQDYFLESCSIPISNEGDTILYVNSIYASSPGGGVSVSIDEKPSSVDPNSNENARILIKVPETSSEKTYSSSITVKTNGGSETFDLEIVVEYGVLMQVSVSEIDFGEGELYQRKSKTITVSEELGYKPLKGIKIEYPANGWISSTDITSIPAGGSEKITISMHYDGNMQPYKEYMWDYRISAQNTQGKRIPISTKMLLGVDNKLDRLSDLKKESSGSASEIASSMYTVLKASDEQAKGRTDGVEDLIDIISFSDSVISVLESYNEVDRLTSEGDYDGAYDSMVRASVGVKMMKSYSGKIKNNELKNQVSGIETETYSMMDKKVNEVASHYENVLNSGDVSTLEKMNAYSRLSQIWGLLGDSEKETEYRKMADVQYEEYTKLVDQAKEERLESENLIQEMQSGVLSKWGNSYVLVNPLNYETFSGNYDYILQNYRDAANNYESAGEVGMKSNTINRLNSIKGMFITIFRIFYALIAFYALLFTGILTVCVKGIISYRNDIEEVHLGGFMIG